MTRRARRITSCPFAEAARELATDIARARHELRHQADGLAPLEPESARLLRAERGTLGELQSRIVTLLAGHECGAPADERASDELARLRNAYHGAGYTSA
jgi:hypothetical protein